MADVAYLLFLQAAAGATVMLRVLFAQPLADRFYRVSGAVVLLLAGLALACAPWRARSPVADAVAAGAAGEIAGGWILVWSTGAFAAAVATFNALMWVRRRAAGVALRAAMLIAFVAVAQAALAFSGPIPGMAGRALLVAGALLSSVLVGSGLVGMLVGHHYLTDSRLPWAPLETCSTAFLALAGAQAVLVAVAAGVAGGGRTIAEALALTEPAHVFVWIRLVPGLLAPVVLAAMIRKTVQLRANMSATGLFYVAMILVACGEAFSRYLLVVEGVLL